MCGQYYDRVARAAERAEPDPAPPLTFLDPHDGPTNYDSDLSVTRRLETRRRELQATVENREADVTAIEVRFGIEKRWQPMDEQYQHALHYVATRNYQRALGKLQRLVVQRLFELHKLNLAQTGKSPPISCAAAASLHSRVQGPNVHREKPSAPLSNHPDSCQSLQRCSRRTESTSCAPRLDDSLALQFPRGVCPSPGHSQGFTGA